MRSLLSLLIFLIVIFPEVVYTQPKCEKWDIHLPKKIKPERVFFDEYTSNNLFIVGEGGNGIFLYDIHTQKISQIYYARVVTDSVKQTSLKTIGLEHFYSRGELWNIDIYSHTSIPERILNNTGPVCRVKNGKLYLLSSGTEKEIAPFLGEYETCTTSQNEELLLFANKYAGGFVYGNKTGELAKLGFGSDFKFVNRYDIIFVNNSKIKEKCSDSYIYYWLNSAIETFIIHKENVGCVRYPDAGKDTLIFVKDNVIYKCPLDLMNAVMNVKR